MALSAAEQEQLRADLFAACLSFVEKRGGFASRDELVDFELRGRRIGLIDRNRGIRNPRELDETLSIVKAADGPYSDEVDENGLLLYDFAPGPLGQGDNRKMLAALERRTPIILFEKPLPNVYIPVLPVYVTAVDEERRKFEISTLGDTIPLATPADHWITRNYRAVVVQQRVHQPVFRATVLVAYQRTCAICRLKHPELLDAAHIIPDRAPEGVAAVTNGMALCKIHHSAYDQFMIGVDPDYRVHVNRDLLAEIDGPMLKHGIQEMHGTTLTVPSVRSNRPSRDALASRFEQFTAR